MFKGKFVSDVNIVRFLVQAQRNTTNTANKKIHFTQNTKC